MTREQAVALARTRRKRSSTRNVVICRKTDIDVVRDVLRSVFHWLYASDDILTAEVRYALDDVARERRDAGTLRRTEGGQ